MQIDFHHTVVYVISRLAGFTPEKADIISHASQYVDDATRDGIINFRTGEKYSRISSAHKTMDLHNAFGANNQTVWVPFHFLPGNSGLPSTEDRNAGLIKKLICRPNSYIAQDMLESCLADRNKPYALHRLGVTLHVFADTFAHQDFAGVVNTLNVKGNIEAEGDNEEVNKLLKSLPKAVTNLEPKNKFMNGFNSVLSKIVGKVLPLGHGAALTFPDMPFLKWSYTNLQDIPYPRDNTQIFMDAIEHIFAFLKRYRNEDPEKDKIPEVYLVELRKNLSSFTETDGEGRHVRWLESIAHGQFGFRENIQYIAKGKGSWKEKAFRTNEDHDLGFYDYNDEFLNSDWKLFHDALQKHRYEITNEILPKYGICVA